MKTRIGMVDLHRPLRWMIVLACLLPQPVVQAAETGYTLRATELKAKPFLDADTLATLAEKTTVEILTRQGAWMQVKTAEAKQGWIRMLSVRLGNPEQKPRGGNLLSALGVGNRPRPVTTSTVTTGVRGFSEEDLANAQPNGAELEKMKSYAATAADAGKLADGGKLETRPLAYFDENGKALKDKK
jgi:hypothetical protein